MIRFLYILLIGYAGFLRADELLNMSISDIIISPEHMQITVPKRKNDQFREGHSLYLNRSGKVTCPVAITEKLLALLPKSDTSLPLIRRIVNSKSTQKFHEKKGVSYSTIRDDFKKFLKPFVSDVRAFGLHSIKSGAASNPDCRSLNDRLLDRHARWKSSASKHRYIKYSPID